MLTEILTKEFIWNSYIKFFLTPFESFLPWVVALIIMGLIINKILDHLYYRFIQSGNSKGLTRKKCHVLCSSYIPRNSDKHHDTYQ